jgi:hypothetical protein
LGFWASIVVVGTSLGFSVPGLLAVAGVLEFPWDPVVPDAASLLLALAFVAMLVALHHDVPDILRHWTGVGTGFAVMYAVLVGIVYITVVTVVVPLKDQGRLEEVALLEFDEQGSFLQAVDGLGYFLMCLATLFAAGALRVRTDRWIRRVFLLNGLLGVPILLTYLPLLISWSKLLVPIGALWILTVPATGVLTALRFRRHRHQRATEGAASTGATD